MFQATADQSGNIWVAGGEDGLFLLRFDGKKYADKFQRFTLADGLRPYGYLPDGSDPVGPKYLKVIAVEGGAPGTVYVGYEGIPGCENAWDTPANRPGPNGPGLAYVYKSGDADRVTVDAAGKLKVVHYDIFSGPNVVLAEMDGREKLCTIYRIVYDPKGGNLWFGGNHGFAWGDPSYAGNPTCNGAKSCAGVVEHSHPAFNGCSRDADCGPWAWITEDYRGIAVEPGGDVWFGGVARTTRFHWSFFGGSSMWDRFIGAADLTEGLGDPKKCPYGAFPCYIQNRIDVWPDLKGEQPINVQPPLPSERIDDLVFGIAAMPDSSVWIGSGYLGLRHLDPYGTPIGDATARLSSYVVRDGGPHGYVGALALDPADNKTLWVGNRYGLGVDRLGSSAALDQHYGSNVFGDLVGNTNGSVEDIRFIGSGPTRKALVAFRQDTFHNVAGFVAVYSGD